MVRRLVKQQKICPREHYFKQRKPRFFPSRKSACLLKNIVSAEKESRQCVSYLCSVHFRVNIPKLAFNVLCSRNVASFLVIVRTFDFCSEMNRAAVGLYNSLYNFIEGGFSAPVCAEQKNAFAALHLKRNVFEKLFFAEMLRHLRHRKDIVSAALACGECESDCVRIALGFFECFLQPFNAFELAFCHSDISFPVPAALLLDNALKPIDFLNGIFIFFLHCLISLLFFLRKRGI